MIVRKPERVIREKEARERRGMREMEEEEGNREIGIESERDRYSERGGRGRERQRQV